LNDNVQLFFVYFVLISILNRLVMDLEYSKFCSLKNNPNKRFSQTQEKVSKLLTQIFSRFSLMMNLIDSKYCSIKNI